MKTKLITLKEYEKTSPGDLNSKDILEIEKFNKLSKTQIFELGAKNTIKAKQFVGILKVNNKNIQVLPKIFGDENKKILKNLLYILSYTKKIKIKESDIASLGKINDLFEVFVYIFSKELISLLKKDFKKNYHLIEENSNFLKGKLLFTKHFKNNLFNKSKFFVEYENMDENILLNIFMSSTVSKLLKFSKNRQNIKLLKKIDFIFNDIEKVNFKNKKILEKIKFDKQNKNYKNIFSLAKMLYFGNSPNFSKNNLDNFSILFDMNILFEEFIAEFLKKNKGRINNNISKISSQIQNKYVFENNKFKLKPDIVVDFKEDKKLIIDTKYKKLNKDKANNGVSNADIYQMFMYGMRYFEDLGEKNIILIYPNYDGKNYKTVYNSEENIKVFIETINLNFDLSVQNGQKYLIEEFGKILKSC